MMTGVLTRCCSECSVTDKQSLTHGLWLVPKSSVSHFSYSFCASASLGFIGRMKLRYQVFYIHFRFMATILLPLPILPQSVWTGPNVKLGPENIDIAVRISLISWIEALISDEHAKTRAFSIWRQPSWTSKWYRRVCQLEFLQLKTWYMMTFVSSYHFMSTLFTVRYRIAYFRWILRIKVATKTSTICAQSQTKECSGVTHELRCTSELNAVHFALCLVYVVWMESFCRPLSHLITAVRYVRPHIQSLDETSAKSGQRSQSLDYISTHCIST